MFDSATTLMSKEAIRLMTRFTRRPYLHDERRSRLTVEAYEASIMGGPGKVVLLLFVNAT